jgi:hypothetical protein
MLLAAATLRLHAMATPQPRSGGFSRRDLQLLSDEAGLLTGILLCFGVLFMKNAENRRSRPENWLANPSQLAFFVLGLTPTPCPLYTTNTCGGE